MDEFPCCSHCPSVDHPAAGEHGEPCVYGCDGEYTLSDDIELLEDPYGDDDGGDE